jgi:hypothetical protein
MRGVIDCLVRRADGSIVVIAVATDQMDPNHEEYLGVCVEAARQMFPGADVNGRTHYCNR